MELIHGGACFSNFMVDSILSNSIGNPSLETQGQSVGSGEKAGRKFLSKGERAPGY